jgi:hypothetical protein
VTRPQLIDVPVKVYVPLPAAITAPLPEPAPPAAHCTLRDQPAVCALDALAWIERWRGVLRQANADRETAARISSKGATPHGG